MECVNLRIYFIILILSASNIFLCNGNSYLNYDSDRTLPRIIGGHEAIKEYPFIVSLTILGFHTCAGSIINKLTIVTAAHCLDQMPFHRMIKVHVGDRTLTLKEGKMYSVEKMYKHPLWNTTNMDYDVALLRLTKPLVFDKYVQPIKLDKSTSKLRPKLLATVLGWGLIDVYGPYSEVLRVAEIPLIKNSVCMQQLNNSVITPRMLCAGYKEGGIDACQMDSGGPLVYNDTLIGIVSWGIGCAQPESPGVYSRVSKLRFWIEKILHQKYKEHLD